MKTIFTPKSAILYMLLFWVFLALPYKAQSAEFAIINGTYYYSSGANAFTCHVSPPYPGSVPTNWRSPNDYWNGTFYAYYEVIDVPTNQPFRMQMGIFQYYPSAANWDGQNYYETCSTIIPTLQGVGDVVQVNYGSPSGWWQHPNGAVDFTRVYDFESVGPVMYSATPGATGILYPPDAAAWAVRTNYFPCTIKVIVVAVSAGSTFSGWDNYLGGCSTPAQPGTISGSTNPTQGSTQTYSISEVSGATSYTWHLPSGWTGSSTTASITTTVGSSGGTISVTANNSCGSSTGRNLTVTVGCSTPAQPGTISGSTGPTQGSSQTYSISEVAGATSYTWTLPSGWTGSSTTSTISTTVGSSSGTISVTANNSCGSSTARTLSVTVGGGCTPPAQPGTISGNTGPTQGSSQTYSISEVPEATSYSWTLPSGWTGSSTTSSITVTVGSNGGTISVRANNTCGSSTARTIAVSVGCDTPVPQPTPSYGIDYGFELTNKAVPSTDEYSNYADMSNVRSGNGQKIWVTPGIDVYFRTKASSNGCLTASAIQHLIVPARPTTPTFSVDYANETTVQVVGTNIWYSTDNSYLNPIAGTGEKLPVTPGQDLYLWVKPTASSFASMSYHLVVPGRPAGPVYAIDYAAEKTATSVPSTVEYSAQSDMTSASSGAGAALNLTPGTDLYFRTKATASAFLSAISHLDVPGRPAGPVYAIDYTSEKTATSVPSTVEYSTHSDITSATSGAGAAITLTPGTDLYFRTKATGSAFHSTISHLVVPIRPALVYNGPATVTTATITMRADLTAEMTGFDLTDLSVTNGTAQNLRESNTFDVIGSEKGDVKVKIPYNKFGGASFESNEIIVYYDKAVTGINDAEKDGFQLYPNPSNGTVYLKSAGKKPYKVDVLNSNGGYLRSIQITAEGEQSINLQDLAKGVYLLKIYSEAGTSLQKIILE